VPVTNYFTVNGQIVGESTGSNFTQYLSDAMGSVRATVEGKRVKNTYAFKPFGELLAKTGTAPDPAFGWTGSSGSRRNGLRYVDQYNRARHYSTEASSWTSVDPIWPGTLPYSYGGVNPTTFCDPSGLEPVIFQACAFIHGDRGRYPWSGWLETIGTVGAYGPYMNTQNRGFGQNPLKCKLYAFFTIDSCAIGKANFSYKPDIAISEIGILTKTSPPTWIVVHKGKGHMVRYGETASHDRCSSTYKFNLLGFASVPAGQTLPLPIRMSGSVTATAGPDKVTLAFNIWERTAFPDFEFRMRVGSSLRIIGYKSRFSGPEIGLTHSAFGPAESLSAATPTSKDCCGSC
jgi:RHS repeat-associated protein